MKKLILLFILTLAGSALTPSLQASQHPQMEVAECGMEVRTAHGSIELTNCTGKILHVQIYSITGQIVKSFDMADGHTTVELPQGCYIVKHPMGTHKVIVR